jgi:hypothetical protein
MELGMKWTKAETPALPTGHGIVIARLKLTSEEPPQANRRFRFSVRLSLCEPDLEKIKTKSPELWRSK